MKKNSRAAKKEKRKLEAEARNAAYQALPLEEKVKRNPKKFIPL